MAQFRAYHSSRASRRDIPFLLDVQSDWVRTGSRIVIPLVRKQVHGLKLSKLNIEFNIAGVMVVAATSDMAAVDERELNREAADLSASRGDIIAAIDFLISGY